MSKTKNKRYVILHIETGSYISTDRCHVEWECIYPKIVVYGYILTISITELERVGINRQDFILKKDAIYFRDKVSALTFLREIYLPKTNNDWYRDIIRRFNRNEFEIIEV